MSADAEQSRRKANMVAQWDGKLGPEANLALLENVNC